MKLSKRSPIFQSVFFSALLITLLSGGGSLWLAQTPDLNPQQARIFETLITTWTMGVGAIIGLLGSHSDSDQNDNP